MKNWEEEAALWVRDHIRPELLDAWLFDEDGQNRSFDEVWSDLERARQVVFSMPPEDLEYALTDLYCAAYRWHLVCSSPLLPPQLCHRQAMISAVAEVKASHQLGAVGFHNEHKADYGDFAYPETLLATG